MRVLITGGAGFIGSNLARHWVRSHENDEVVVFDALTYAGRRESLLDLATERRFRFVEGDVRDPAALDQVVPGSDLVIHLAAESHNDRAVTDPLPFVDTNVRGTATLLEACRRHDVGRLHHVSTDEVFGSLPLGTSEKFTTETPYRPHGPYSASKAGADHLVRAWHDTYKLPVTISNCSNNYGPYQFPEKLIPLAITRILTGERVPLYGDGRNVRDWIFVEDHCDALDLIARKGTSGATYLVSAGSELANIEVVRRILRILGKSESSIEYVADRPGHDLRYALDAHALVAELGWRPRHDFDSALERTVAWYRTHEAWWRPLLAPAVRTAA